MQLLLCIYNGLHMTMITFIWGYGPCSCCTKHYWLRYNGCCCIFSWLLLQLFLACTSVATISICFYWVNIFLLHMHLLHGSSSLHFFRYYWWHLGSFYTCTYFKLIYVWCCKIVFWNHKRWYIYKLWSSFFICLELHSITCFIYSMFIK